MSAKILSLGAMYFEITSLNFPIGDSVPIESETVGSGYVVDPGGSAIYFSRVCAALLLSPIFIGKMGNDRLGKQLEEMLTETGITPAFIKSDNVQTNNAINYVRPDGKTLMFVSGTANQSLEASEVEERIVESLSNVDYLYLGGSFKLTKLLPVYGEVIEKTKSHKVKIVIDHGRVNDGITEDQKEIVRTAVTNSDYYFPSKDELLAVWGGANIEAAIKIVRSKTKKTMIAVKDGEKGAWGSIGETAIHVPVFSVEPRNTVGAGDSFNAGFIRAQVDGLDLEQSLRFACATAALKISKPQLPTLDEVKFLCQMN